MRNAPLAMVTVTKVVVPSPSSRLTLLNARVIAPVVVSLAKAKLPVRRCPNAVSSMLRALTLTPRAMSTPSMVRTMVVVLIATSKDPVKVTPGMSMATSADRLPARPPGVPAVAPKIANTPLPLLTTTMSRSGVPRRRLTLSSRTKTS